MKESLFVFRFNQKAEMSNSWPREKNFLDQTLDVTLGPLLGILTPRKYRPAIKLSTKSGEVTVIGIHKGSHAERSGIHVGDIILEIGGQTITANKAGNSKPVQSDPSNLESFANRLLEVQILAQYDCLVLFFCSRGWHSVRAKSYLASMWRAQSDPSRCYGATD